MKTPPVTLRLFYSTLLLILLYGPGFQSPVRADQVGPYTPEHWSANKRYCLQVAWDYSPSRPILILSRKTASGLESIWKLKSPQKEPPTHAHITDDGQYVVLEDEWGNSGQGIVLAFIQPAGRVLTTYQLADVLTGDERSELIHTVSNTWWTIGMTLFLRPPQRQFAFITAKGAIHLFDLTTGKPIAVNPTLAQEIRNERIPIARKALHSANKDLRYAAINQIAQLNDRASIPDLIRLLNDQTTERFTVSMNPDVKNGSYREHPVRRSAGMALVQLMGPDAIPHLAKRMDEYDAFELTRWTWLIAKAGGPKARAFLTDYAKHTGKWIGGETVIELLEQDDGSFIRANRHLLSDRRDYIRIRALRDIAEHPQKEDEVLLRRALKSEDSATALWALRGLIHLQPAGMEVVLKRITTGKQDSIMVAEAERELARRGDKNAIARKLALVSQLETHSKVEHGLYGCIMLNLDAVLQVLIERQPPGLAQALAKASKSDCEIVRVSVFGAMAALGDQKALNQVRAEAGRTTQKGDELERYLGVQRRASAILWLGMAHDIVSIPLLHAAKTDTDKEIREASTKSLAKLGR